MGRGRRARRRKLNFDIHSKFGYNPASKSVGGVVKSQRRGVNREREKKQKNLW